MGADFAEMDSIVLLAHVDSNAEPAGVAGDQTRGDAGGDIAVIELAVPVRSLSRPDGTTGTFSSRFVLGF